MVGYALTAASDESYENILITVIDADDFDFDDNSVNIAIYSCSRKFHNVVRVDKSESSDSIPYGLIYDVIFMLKKEERKCDFPVAIVWSCPEFGELELVSSEFQNVWPAVMLLNGAMEHPYVNITDVFFSKGIRPLQASFFCDVMNMMMHMSGVYIGDCFLSCFNSVFCDVRFFGVEKALFKSRYLAQSIDFNIISYIRKQNHGKIRLSRRSVVKTLRKCMQDEFEYARGNDLKTRLINIKKWCVDECLWTTYRCLKRRTSVEDVYEKIKSHINVALKKIIAITNELSDKCIINKKTDIYYMTFDDLLSALTFADHRMDLKTVIRNVRIKNKISRKNPAPDAVLPDCRMMYKTD